MDKYIVNKIIGEGSFGKAILVKSKHNGEQYVVKEIGISKMKPKEKDEARKEVTVLSKMRHPNIVQYTESFEENGKLFIVMEYCEGGDLYALINKQKGIPFKEQQVLNWFVQLCLALKHVHDRKILHRDIKTSNIFLTKSGTIKLGDFGIARVLNNTMELARTCIGTPYYLSPEICENKPYNNKSDVWALGCVVYETLTLKHAFEAGNMKNLVLKIIRGSYPPIPSRYSYDLRTLVSQLFRRNPRERPSINSILRKPFLSSLTEQFLSPQQHDEEFSHTVLHKGRPKSSAYKPSYGARYQPVAAKRMQNLEVRGGAVGVRNRRDHQIAAAYGQSLAAKKQKPVVSRISKASHDKEDFLEKRRRQLLEEEKKRKNALNEEKKKKLENLQRRQRERALKLKEEQMKRARDEARVQNLKRSAELWDHKANGESDANLKKQILAANVRDRPVSAPRERGDYDKYHQYLNRLEAGDKNAAANIAAPGLNRVKEAWEERVKNQDAVMLAAKVNRAAGERAAGQAHLVSEYLQRKHEAMMNKNRGAIQMQKNVPVKNPNVGVAGALKPYSGADDRIGNERKYLARLEQIRQQNYQDRKVLHQKYMEHKNAYKVEVPLSSEDDDEVRKRKVEALQQQAGDRAKIIKENMERRREMLDENDRNKGNVGQKMKNHDAMARARGIIPPDERPVKYNPNPISITQALHAVGAPIPQKTEAPSPFMPSEIPPPLIDEMMSPSRADPRLKKKVLQRVNQRFSVDYEDDQRAENEKENMRGGEKDDVTGQSRDQEVKTSSRPLPKLPEKPATEESESRPSSAWQARRNEADVVNKILGLPLQDTKSLLEGTVSPPVPPHAPDVKRHWAVPSGTVVRHLNEMALQEPTMTVVETSKDEIENKTKTIERPLPKLKSELSPEKPISEVQTPSKEFSAGEPGSLVEKATLSPDNSNLNAANNKETPERLLAANFQPSNRNGTYVISSLSVTERGDVKESLDEGKENSAAIKNPVNSSVDKLLSASEENKKAEIKTGNIVKSGDVDDDVEEVEFVNEVKSSVKADVSQTAWGEEPSKSNESQVKPEKPLIQSLETRDKKQSPLSKSSSSPKPVLTPQPSLSSAPPTRSNRSSYSQDTLKLSGSTLDKSATKSGSMSGSANRLLFSSGSPTPLITKVNENQAKSPAPSTDHQTENLDKSDPTPLRKSLYSTANDQVIMKLTLGAFDSPYPKFQICHLVERLSTTNTFHSPLKLLRTCSLPDLSSDAKNPRDKQNISDEDEAPAEESMNDTNFDDVLEEVGNANEIPDVEDPDEDELSEFCANLQSVLDNSSKPDSSSHPFATELSESMRTLEDEDNSCSEDDDVKIREDWQSDSCSESSSCSEDISDTESVFSRLEDNREELERELGLDKFKKAYRYVQATHEDEDESVRECEERIRAVLGEKHDILYPKILQLVMADGAYCEDNS